MKTWNMPGRFLIAAAALLVAFTARGEALVTEVYSLGYRSVDEVAPMLKPLVPPPGAVTGMHKELVIRTTPANMKEIKRVLAAVDRPPRSLLISVKRDTPGRAGQEAADGTVEGRNGDTGQPPPPRLEAGARTLLDKRRAHRAAARLHGADARADARGVQTIRTIEGQDAFISAGVELPVRKRYRTLTPHGLTTAESAAYRRVVRGFYAKAMVIGDRVRVAINSRDSRLSRGFTGGIRSHQADTVVSGRVGEWLMVGRNAALERRSPSGTAYAAGAGSLDDSALMIKVEVLH